MTEKNSKRYFLPCTADLSDGLWRTCEYASHNMPSGKFFACLHKRQHPATFILHLLVPILNSAADFNGEQVTVMSVLHTQFNNNKCATAADHWQVRLITVGGTQTPAAAAQHHQKAAAQRWCVLMAQHHTIAATVVAVLSKLWG
jgi:hypothetical protein